MAVVNGYATLAEAKAWIGITDSADDSLLESRLTAVSRWIDSHCHRQFWKDVGAVRVLDSCDGWTVRIPDTVSLTSVQTDDDFDGSYETTWAAGDWQLGPADAPYATPEPRPYTELWGTGARMFLRPIGLPYRTGLIRLTGTFGWPAVPAAVHDACLLQVARLHQRRKSPEGVSGWNDYGAVRISSRLDPDVCELLDGSYRRLLVA